MDSFNPKLFHGLENHGLKNLGSVYWNLSTPKLYEESLQRREGILSHLGPLVVHTGERTGRSPKDKFVVKEPSSEGNVGWGKVNIPMEPKVFDALLQRVQAYLQGKDVFIQDCYAGTDPKYRIPVRVIDEVAWHSQFARSMFVQMKERSEGHSFIPSFTVIHVPNYFAMPEIDGTNSEAFVLMNFGRRIVLIGGTSYAGEVKKSIFTLMNYLLPLQGVLSMHCSANVGEKGDVAIMFGLSGTGKTTLSADPERMLIGDDEHGWSDDGVFNIEGGCYAKVINLSKEAEPFIFDCTRRFGTILENVVIDPDTRRIDLNDASITENTRASYPIPHIPNALRDGMAGHPKNVIFLTCDAFGVMPPIAKLTPEQAMYHFLSGYTAKVAGTERGVTEPQATFSACFGEPFMALPPRKYAELLGQKIKKHNADVWLINTGWTAGPYGVGHRMPIKVTRTLLGAVLRGDLAKVPTKADPFFGLQIPESCAGVDKNLLQPWLTWRDRNAYNAKATELAGRFHANFKRFDNMPENILQAGPVAMATV